MKGFVRFQDIVYLSLCYVYSQIHWFFMIQFTVYASCPFVRLLYISVFEAQSLPIF